MTLTLDELDYNTVQKAIATYQRLNRWQDERGGVMLPDGSSCLAGAVIAELCRDLEEYRSLWEADHPR